MYCTHLIIYNIICDVPLKNVYYLHTSNFFFLFIITHICTPFLVLHVLGLPLSTLDCMGFSFFARNFCGNNSIITTKALSRGGHKSKRIRLLSEISVCFNFNTPYFFFLPRPSRITTTASIPPDDIHGLISLSSVRLRTTPLEWKNIIYRSMADVKHIL